MSLKNISLSQNPQRIIAIDPSSHSLGWAVIDISKPELIAYGKISLTKTLDISIKFDMLFLFSSILHLTHQFHLYQARLELPDTSCP